MITDDYLLRESIDVKRLARLFQGSGEVKDLLACAHVETLDWAEWLVLNADYCQLGSRNEFNGVDRH